MDKIIIHLIIPAIEKDFDVKIPVHMTIGDLTGLLVKAVEEVSEQHYVSSGEEVLCLREKRIILHQDLTVKQYGIQNGNHIVMI